MILVRMVVWIALSLAIIAVELRLGHPSSDQRPINRLTDQLMSLATMATLAGGLAGSLVRQPGADRMMVFQEFDQLLSWKTVKGNVMFPLLSSGTLRGRAAQERALAYIDKVNLIKFADSFPHTLSGGMKQRVAIARAMAMEPAVLLMDEPFGALDEIVRDHLNEQLLQLWAKTDKTVVFVTHSIPEAAFLSTKIVVMSPRPGGSSRTESVTSWHPSCRGVRRAAPSLPHRRSRRTNGFP